MRTHFQSFFVFVPITLWVCLSALGCESQQFSGSGGQHVDAKGPQEGVDLPSGTDELGKTEEVDTASGTAPACDATGDFIEFKYPKAIEACISQGRLWNFETGECSGVDKAKSFDCTWDGVEAALPRFGGSADVAKQYRKAGGKLVACGEGKRTILWLTFTPPKGEVLDCQYSKAYSFYVECFRLVESTAEGIAFGKLSPKERVLECLRGEK